MGSPRTRTLWSTSVATSSPSCSAPSMAYTLVFAIGAYAHHSGYWSDDSGMHDYHHEAFNVNYGNAHLLDYLYGTYRTRDSSARGGAQKQGKGSASQAAADKVQ